MAQWNILQMTTFDDWPNLILHGLSHDESREYRDIIALNISKERLKEVVVMDVVIMRSASFPIFALSMDQDIDKVTSFLNETLTKRSLMFPRSRQVVMYHNIGTSAKVHKALQRFTTCFTHNVMSIVMVKDLASLTKCIRDKCQLLNLTKRQKYVVSIEADEIFSKASSRIMNMGEVEKMARTLAKIPIRDVLRTLSFRDVELASQIDRDFRGVSSNLSISRFVILSLLKNV
jgi:hypothetical protein